MDMLASVTERDLNNSGLASCLSSGSENDARSPACEAWPRFQLDVMGWVFGAGRYYHFGPNTTTAFQNAQAACTCRAEARAVV